MCGWGSTSSGGWLQVCFNTEIVPTVKRIKVKGQVLGPYVGTNNGDHWESNSLTLQASNNGNDWIDLKTINTSFNNYQTVDVEIENETAFKYYRFSINNKDYVGLSNVHMYTK